MPGSMRVLYAPPQTLKANKEQTSPRRPRKRREKLVERQMATESSGPKPVSYETVGWRVRPPVGRQVVARSSVVGRTHIQTTG